VPLGAGVGFLLANCPLSATVGSPAVPVSATCPPPPARLRTCEPVCALEPFAGVGPLTFPAAGLLLAVWLKVTAPYPFVDTLERNLLHYLTPGAAESFRLRLFDGCQVRRARGTQRAGAALAALCCCVWPYCSFALLWSARLAALCHPDPGYPLGTSERTGLEAWGAGCGVNDDGGGGEREEEGATIPPATTLLSKRRRGLWCAPCACPQVGIVANDKGRSSTTCVTQFSDGNWHLLVASYNVTNDRGDTKLFVDGVALDDPPSVVNGALASPGCIALGGKSASCSAAYATGATSGHLTGVSISAVLVYNMQYRWCMGCGGRGLVGGGGRDAGGGWKATRPRHDCPAMTSPQSHSRAARLCLCMLPEQPSVVCWLLRSGAVRCCLLSFPSAPPDQPIHPYHRRQHPVCVPAEQLQLLLLRVALPDARLGTLRVAVRGGCDVLVRRRRHQSRGHAVPGLG
jgi:hypothetical protein